MESIKKLKEKLSDAWKKTLDPDTVQEIEKKLNLLDIISDVIPYMVQRQHTIDASGKPKEVYMIQAGGMGRNITELEAERIKEFAHEVFVEQGQVEPMQPAEVVKNTKEQPITKNSTKNT